MVALWAYSVPGSAGALPGGSLDPGLIQKYVDPMPVSGIMQKAPNPAGFTGDYYEIALKEFDQQVLSSVDISGSQLPPTKVWSYGTVNPAGAFHYPSFSIEARVNRPVRIKWINGLVDAAGN
ncbi:MAG: hypothetical protein MUC98_06770 [Desulfobacterota bacterium]|nr:hypothetical protein [Thermodesulfobacteriota bacterium]